MLSKMDKLVDIGLIKQGEEENLYNNMLARIANSDLSSRNLSVSVVDALSSLVFLVKNKWKDKVPSTHLTKKQFVHILAYICEKPFSGAFVFALLTHGNIIFDILEQSSFQKYTTLEV